MVSKNVVFWDVDTQVDFMLPGGKLYVPGAENLIPNLKRLVDAAREGRVFLAGDADAHSLQDEEFKHWPPHCLQGTPGAQYVPETLTDKVLVIPNVPDFPLPRDFRNYQQLILEKNTLDVFENPNTEAVLERLGKHADYVIFGVVTEYCVRLAAKGLIERGHRVLLVKDAIETLNDADGKRTHEELAGMGVRMITTDQALALVYKKTPAVTVSN
ncbi:MAG: cysteine hydrolase family protein [Candidatus Acidiferrales bacterium]